MVYANLFNLEGKIAVVTGGSNGLGKCIVEGLLEYGVKVAILDLVESKTESDDICYKYCDVGKAVQVSSAVKDIIKHFRKIDILVNCAGTVKSCETIKMADEDWDVVNKVNLYGSFYLCREVGKYMISQKSGNIVNIASQAGVIGIPRGNSNYCASKGGIISLTKALSLEWAPYHIRVNSISPCHFRTPLTEKLLENSEIAEGILKRIPLGRIGEAADIVGPVIFLASNASSMITGHNLMVDGGVTSSY
jgi:NAD(P)-dependent dehydrogenase (short-subunit alcohol dehydrogenase family)